MTTSIITVNHIEGFHCWPDAPDTLRYLKDRHRHIFVIECNFKVSHDAREIVDFYTDCISCTVREDGFGGATVTRR